VEEFYIKGYKRRQPLLSQEERPRTDFSSIFLRRYQSADILDSRIRENEFL
jgi:hypothetical protein